MLGPPLSCSYFFFFYCYSAHRYLPSFPTRRSSDLGASQVSGVASPASSRSIDITRMPSAPRSEEHTSELQSPYDLVCRHRLEKKKYSQILPVSSRENRQYQTKIYSQY